MPCNVKMRPVMKDNMGILSQYSTGVIHRLGDREGSERRIDRQRAIVDVLLTLG
jgi:hypothetical protein